MKFSTRVLSAGLIGVLLFAGCSKRQSDTETQAAGDSVAEIPALRTRSDSIAMNVFNAVGGPEAWAAVRYLRFDFAVEKDSARTLYRKHLWDRKTGDYRLEWLLSGDSSWVVLLNVNTREGEAFLNGAAVAEADQDSLVFRGFQAYVNDTYWLLAPTKLLEPGVERLHLPGWSDEQMDVITTMYNEPNIAPNNQFWFWVDKESSKLMRWAYVQGSDPNTGPTVYEWGDYESFATDTGILKFMPRKIGAGSDLLTDNIAMPSSVADGVFEDPTPKL